MNRMNSMEDSERGLYVINALAVAKDLWRISSGKLDRDGAVYHIRKVSLGSTDL